MAKIYSRKALPLRPMLVISLSESDSSKLKNDPIELVKAIREETHHFRANAYDMAIAAKVAKDLLNTKQGLHESLLDCTHGFKNAREVMKTKNGAGMLHLRELPVLR